MRLFPLRFGTVRGEDLPIIGVLVHHPDGATVLVDTGPPQEMAGDDTAPFEIRPEDRVTARLDELGLSPADVDYVVSTHLDPDHAGALDLFPHSRIVVQRRELDAARSSGLPRYEWQRAHWDREELTYELVDGDTVLLPGIELVDSHGHSPGHQSVLVRLPHTGPVLITGDAVPAADGRDPDTRVTGGHDYDEALARESTRRLANLVREEHVKLVVYSHDRQQWDELRHAPRYYE